MRTQPIAHQPNFNGNIIFAEKAGEKTSSFVTEKLGNLLNKSYDLVKEKPYDIFVLKSKRHPNFFQVAAGDSFESALESKGKKVFVQKDVVYCLENAVRDIILFMENNPISKSKSLRNSSLSKDYNFVSWKGIK